MLHVTIKNYRTDVKPYGKPRSCNLRVKFPGRRHPQNTGAVGKMTRYTSSVLPAEKMTHRTESPPSVVCFVLFIRRKEQRKTKQNNIITYEHKRKTRTDTTNRQQTTLVEERDKALLKMFAVVVDVVSVDALAVHVTAVDINIKEFFESNSFDLQGA